MKLWNDFEKKTHRNPRTSLHDHKPNKKKLKLHRLSKEQTNLSLDLKFDVCLFKTVVVVVAPSKGWWAPSKGWW